MRKMIANQQGFTLIEVLVAMVILLGGVLAYNVLQIRSIRENTTVNYLTGNNALMQDIYERFQALKYSDTQLDDNTAATNPYTAAGNWTELNDDLPSFITAVEWRVEESADTGAGGIDFDGSGTVERDETNVKRVTVTIRYFDRGDNKQQTVAFYKHAILEG